MGRPPKLCRCRNSAYIYVDRKQVFLGEWGSSEANAAYARYLLELSKDHCSRLDGEKRSAGTCSKRNVGSSGKKRKLGDVEKETAACVSASNGVATVRRSRASVGFNQGAVPLSSLLVGFLDYFSGLPSYNKTDWAAYLKVTKKLRELFEDFNVDEFGIRQLSLFRETFLEEGYVRNGERKEYSRNYLNKLVKYVRAIFNWGASEGIVPAAICDQLKYFKPLMRGRTSAVETRKRRVVADSEIEAILPFLLPIYRDIIRLLRETGMRPSELCHMRVGDVRRDGEVWVYAPGTHKTQWRGNSRYVALGKRAQGILGRYLVGRDESEFVFSPKEAMAQKWEERRLNRKTRIQPSQVRRFEDSAGTKLDRFKDCYDTQALGRALVTAFQKAERAGVNLERWTLYELRHTAITEVKFKYGAEAAQHFAGHHNLSTQDIYDHSSLLFAKDVALKRG